MSLPRSQRVDARPIENLRTLIETLEELSVLRMQNARHGIEANRTFSKDLRAVFQNVMQAHRTEVELLLKLRKKSFFSFSRMIKAEKSQPSVRRMTILMSSQVRLSGSIVMETFRSFLSYLKSIQTDVIIFGRVGKELFEAALPGRSFTYYTMSDKAPNAASLEPMLKKLSDYDAITIFHGTFVNFVSQNPTETDLSPTTIVQEDSRNKQGNRSLLFIFEPDLETIIKYFSSQIFATLVHQLAQESWLALLGSRITAMEQASRNIENYEMKLQFQETMLERDIQNNKQRERLSGIALWSQEH